MENNFDVIIVGGSYSGLAAAMALGRALINVLVIDSGKPCNRQTPHSHNFLTQDGKTPAEIANLGKEQVAQYKTVKFINDLAISGRKSAGNSFEVEVQSGEIFKTKKLIFATGINDQMKNIDGFAECWGISVLHCPYCHGYEVREQSTGILANGDDAYEMASLISNWTKDLTIFTEGKSSISDEQLEKLQAHNIKIEEREVATFEHIEGQIQNVLFKDGSASPIRAIYARLQFLQHSDIPEMLGCEFTDDGYIKVDFFQKTNVPGVFACGDNTTRMRTVANAVSMGTMTGIAVSKDLIFEKF